MYLNGNLYPQATNERANKDDNSTKSVETRCLRNSCKTVGIRVSRRPSDLCHQSCSSTLYFSINKGDINQFDN